MASESFTADDGTRLVDYDPNWDSVDGTFYAYCLVISDGQCRVNAGWDLGGAVNTASSSDTSQIVFKAKSTDMGDKYVCVRAGGLNGTGYNLTFFDNNSGVFTSLQLYKGYELLFEVEVYLDEAADYTVRIEASGDSSVYLVGYIDGVEAISYTDSADPLAGGHPGFFVRAGSTPYNTCVDDWTDGVVEGGTVTRNLIAVLTNSSQTTPPSTTVARALRVIMTNAGSTTNAGATAVRLLTGTLTNAGYTTIAAQQIIRAVSAILTNAGSTADITYTLGTIRSLVASLTNSGSTTNIVPILLRSLSASLLLSGQTPDVVAKVTRLVAANLSNISQTTDVTVSLGVIRSVMAVLTNSTSTADVLATSLRNLIASLSDSGSTPDITVTLSNLISLVAGLVNASSTSNIVETMARSLVGYLGDAGSTPDVSASSVRRLIASIHDSSWTPDDLILVVLALGLITDPGILSLGVDRALVPKSIERSISSLTTERTIYSM